MFDLVSKNKRFAQFILLLMAIPFAFFGIDAYFTTGSSSDSVATVGGQEVSQLEFSEAMREQQAQMRQQMGRNFDPAMFDNPEIRFAVLEQVINQKLLSGKAKDENFRVSDAQLQQFIAAIPAFAEDGKFSPERYRQLLASQNMTPVSFEQRLRVDLAQAAVQEPIANSAIVARQSTQKYLGLLEQQREVAVAMIEVAPFVKDVKLDDAAVREFYDKNPLAFQVPEQARIEYLMLTQDALTAQTTVDADEVRKQYEANAKQYSAPEERAAAHVLIAVKADASEAEVAKAKKLADEIYAKARANPAKFADLAREFSQDQGSAQQGGDLGNFGRGAMVKAFEDAAFGAKVGDLLPPVRTDFGWHVIKVTGGRAARTQPFDEVKGNIEIELKKQKAATRFAAAADQFQNLVYEQADSLAGAGKALDLKIVATPFITRAQAQQIGLGNAKFVQALFAPESVQAKRNTEAMEVAPNTLIAARIVEFKPAAPRPFDEVKDEIRRQLIMRDASLLAAQAGAEKLKLLEQGKSDKELGLVFSKPTLVGRSQYAPGLSPDALKGIFSLNPDKLPAYAGAGNERGGFSLFRVLKVVTPAATDKARFDAAATRLTDQIGREMLTAYLSSLKAKADVKVNQKNLEKK